MKLFNWFKRKPVPPPDQPPNTSQQARLIWPELVRDVHSGRSFEDALKRMKSRLRVNGMKELLSNWDAIEHSLRTRWEDR